jgi:hypothetical protein
MRDAKSALDQPLQLIKSAFCCQVHERITSLTFFTFAVLLLPGAATADMDSLIKSLNNALDPQIKAGKLDGWKYHELISVSDAYQWFEPHAYVLLDGSWHEDPLGHHDGCTFARLFSILDAEGRAQWKQDHPRPRTPWQEEWERILQVYSPCSVLWFDGWRDPPLDRISDETDWSMHFA